MRFLSTVLLLLSSFIIAEGAKNPHGFDAGFLKAMNQGAKNSAFLKEVTNFERKQFWKNLLKKAKPASDIPGYRSEHRQAKAVEDDQKVEDNGSEQKGQPRKLSYNNNAQGYYQYANNANQGNNYYNQGQNYNNGNYNYGNNAVNYNYNGAYDAEYYNQANGEEEVYGIDWSNLGFDMKQYSLKYTGCSAVKTYDSSKAANGWGDVLTTKRFALFRLCPTNNCNKYSVNGCGRNYGEYVLEMDSFLEGVVEFNRQRYWHYCHFCRRCNALESYGERMAGLTEEQMEYFEQMQAEAEEYYEMQQQMYEQENEQYANENAAYYNYYYQNNQQQQNNGNADDNGGNQRRRRVLKMQVPKTKRELYNEQNSNSMMSYYQWKKSQYNQNGEGEEDYDEYQEYIQNMNKNMYNNFFWDTEVYGEWEEDWNVAWLAFNWQVLPYCTTSELETCYAADETCDAYDEDFEEDADAMGGFSACTQIDDGYYVGPHCNSDGYTITLGVYSDEYCDTFIGDQVSIYDVLGYDIDEEFDFFPQECVSCEEGGEDMEFGAFLSSNQDFDEYEAWLNARWQEYVEMAEEMYQENMGDEQNQYYQQQQAYYQAQNYNENNQQGYYYANGQKQQNGGGSYYYGDQQQQQYAQYGGQNYQNQQMSEQYGSYGASMLNQGMNFYYNRGNAGTWITNEAYNKEEWAQEQEEEYGDYYWYKKQQQNFEKTGIADVCGALYTYAAKCNKHLTSSSSSSTTSGNTFRYSYGSTSQEANEETVCNFIDNLQTQKYDEFGEIVLDGYKQGYVIDFLGTNWRDPDQVKAQAEKAGITVGQAVGLSITMAACLVMAVWACCLHSTLARKNIPWRPKRGKNADPTDINRQSSGIVMGRSRSGMSAKETPLI